MWQSSSAFSEKKINIKIRPATMKLMGVAYRMTCPLTSLLSNLSGSVMECSKYGSFTSTALRGDRSYTGTVNHVSRHTHKYSTNMLYMPHTLYTRTHTRTYTRMRTHAHTLSVRESSWRRSNMVWMTVLLQRR